MLLSSHSFEHLTQGFDYFVGGFQTLNALYKQIKYDVAENIHPKWVYAKGICQGGHM